MNVANVQTARARLHAAPASQSRARHAARSVVPNRQIIPRIGRASFAAAVKRVEVDDGSVVFMFVDEEQKSRAPAGKDAEGQKEASSPPASVKTQAPAGAAAAVAAPAPEPAEPAAAAPIAASESAAASKKTVKKSSVQAVSSVTTTTSSSSTISSSEASLVSTSSSVAASAASASAASSSSVDMKFKSVTDVNSLVVPLDLPEMPELPPIEGDALQKINALMKRAEMEAEAKGRAVSSAKKSAESASGNLQRTVDQKAKAEESEVQFVTAAREKEEARWQMDEAQQEQWRSSLEAQTRMEVSGALSRAETIFRTAAPSEKMSYAEQLARLTADGEKKQQELWAEANADVELWAKSAMEAKSNADTALKAKQEFDAAVSAVFEEARAKRKSAAPESS